MNPILMFLQSVALQTAREFLDGTRTSVGSDLVSSLGETVSQIISFFVVIVFLILLLFFAKIYISKYSYPEGRKIGRIKIVNLDGTIFDANVSENTTFRKNDLKELYESGIVKTKPETIDRLERDDNFHVYNARIVKYERGVRYRSRNRLIQIHTRASLEDPTFFSNAQRGFRSLGSMMEPEVTRIVYAHPESTVEKFKAYNGKMKQVHSIALIPTKPHVKIAQYSNIFQDKHITIPIDIHPLRSDVSEELGSLIEWTPKVAQLEKDLKRKDATMKDFTKVIDDKTRTNSKMNILINRLFGVVEQKRLQGTDKKPEPIRMGSNIMLGVLSVFIGAIAYSAWSQIESLKDYSPWFVVIISAILIGIFLHAIEKKRKEEIEKKDVEVE